MAGTKGKREVVVGEPWPNDIEVVHTEVYHSQWHDPKVVILAGVALVMVLLLVLFFAYGVYAHDTEMLGKILSVAEHSLYLIVGWIVGRSSAKEP